MFKKCKTQLNKMNQIIWVSSVAVLMLAGCERLPTGTMGSELNSDATLAIEKNRVVEASLSARDNIIKGNTFREEPVGVWVASRQSRNLKGFACGAYPLAETLLASYHIDSAKDNQILDNTFIQVDTGVIVEDDGTQIINNDFTQAGGIAIKIGSEIREKYADKSKGVLAAIQNTQVRNNRFAANKPLVQQIQISAPNQATTVLMDNRTNE